MRHEIVGILDPAVALCSAQFVVLAHAVKLQDPVFETRFDVELPRPDFFDPRALRYDRFRPCAAGGCPDLDDLTKRSERHPVCPQVAGNHSPGRLDKVCKLYRRLPRPYL